jgi:RP/EB family microtubule-associated protein
MDALAQGKARLHKVNYNARAEPGVLANDKVFREALSVEGVPRNILGESLTKAKCMASLETLQWMKRHFEQRFAGGEYDGPARRAKAGIRRPGDAVKARPARTPAPSRLPAPGKPAVSQLQRLQDEIAALQKANALSTMRNCRRSRRCARPWMAATSPPRSSQCWTKQTKDADLFRPPTSTSQRIHFF